MELLSFEKEVTYMLQTKTYEYNEEDKVPVIRNWLGREGLQLLQTNPNLEKGACKTVGLFATLDQKFKLWHSKTILPLQYCKVEKKN